MESSYRGAIVGSRYLPRNERTAVVMMVMDSNAKTLIEEPRLIRPSGETGFDQAALETARAALPRRTLDTMGERAKQILKVRAYFHLHKDLPALNLIGPREHRIFLYRRLFRAPSNRNPF